MGLGWAGCAGVVLWLWHCDTAVARSLESSLRLQLWQFPPCQAQPVSNEPAAEVVSLQAQRGGLPAV